ncbi:DUF305 domain-containing protein [Nocardioides sp.]|uniref:DUF305 domain-containing protein n=1 Tax=Nocardioides sp. TaxID=35761 RepID=UPI0035634868
MKTARGPKTAAVVSVLAPMLVLVLVAALSGCADDDSDLRPGASPGGVGSTQSTTAPSMDLAELQPGAPGEDTTTRDPEQPMSQNLANHDDIAFMQMMVLHHRQALEMTAMVPARASDPAVKDVALRIESAQAPEILVMAGWLTDRSIDVPAVNDDPARYDHSEHGHEGLEGMLSDDQLDELEDAEGAAFDRLFLEGMIAHHLGAVAMAKSVLLTGRDQRVNELATDINAEQSIEIERLRAILAAL